MMVVMMFITIDIDINTDINININIDGIVNINRIILDDITRIRIRILPTHPRLLAIRDRERREVISRSNRTIEAEDILAFIQESREEVRLRAADSVERVQNTPEEVVRFDGGFG